MLYDNPIFKSLNRDDYPITNRCTWLNHASRGPHNRFCREWIEDYFDHEMNLGNLNEEKGFEALGRMRREAAALLSTSPERIAFMPNTSYGLNVALQGIDWKSGESLVMSSLEFPAVRAVAHHMENLYGVKLRDVEPEPGNDFVSAEALAGAVAADTRAVVVSWVQFFNGYRLDLEMLCTFCREKDVLLVVDGMQGVGALELDVEESGVDILTAGGQKWLLSPHGTGLIYISERAREIVKPRYIGWLSMKTPESFSTLIGMPYEPVREARVFEVGSYPFPLIAGFSGILAEINRIGIRNIEDRINGLNAVLENYVSGEGSGAYRLTSWLNPARRSGISSFTSPNPEQLHGRLLSEKVITSLREGGIRVSPHYYNSVREMENLVDILSQ